MPPAERRSALGTPLHPMPELPRSVLLLSNPGVASYNLGRRGLTREALDLVASLDPTSGTRSAMVRKSREHAFLAEAKRAFSKAKTIRQIVAARRLARIAREYARIPTCGGG